MRRFLILFVILSAVGCGGYLFFQQPEVRALFQPARPAEDPLDFLRDLPKISPKAAAPKPSSNQRRTPAQAPAPSVEAREPEPSAVTPRNQVPNEDVSRALLGILAARKLGHGLSISVTDETITLYGEVDSAEQLEQIRQILNKAREYRRIDTSHLSVR